ncbi:hypothetical protein BpHYR1_042377, partial [Brachionus plicatilis]
HSLPVIYAFLTRKTQALYISFLRKIKECLEVFPKSINSDFELAFINACDKVFPGTPINGCYFHFKQSMWRKIQDVGLSEDYRADRKIRSTLLLLQCLAYLPEKDVVSAFDELKESVKKYYVAKTIIKRGRYNKKIIERDEPMFSISLWNIHDRLMDDMPRTNNCCESWHNSFIKQSSINL